MFKGVVILLNTIVKKVTYQLKRGTALRWKEVNPILKEGEPGVEIDTGKLKIGNGINHWVDLPYIKDNIYWEKF